MEELREVTMTPPEHPACEWVGLAEDAEAVAICGRPARGVVVDPSGARHFACEDHLSTVKARHATAALEFRTGPVPFRRFPEALP